MNTQRLLFINAMVLLTVTTNCILQVWCETQIAVVQCLVQQASSIQPKLLWSFTIIWYTNYLLIAFQVLNFSFIQLRAVSVELLAHFVSQNIQDHRLTTLWPLASITVCVAAEASVQSEFVCISTGVLILFSFSLIYTVHDLSIQPTRVEGCLHRYCIRLKWTICSLHKLSPTDSH